ncbi:MAG: protein adenylyltransferase SelO, partial [Pelagibacteraceae bacterium]
MKNIGFKFENTYAKLPEILATKLVPVPVKKPKLIIFNNRLAKDLGLDVNSVTEDDLTNLFSGNKLPAGSEPLAQAYCGHQFGHFVMLGDGRAIVLGEHLTPLGKRIDIQFKGSGRTPYSRSGDGRAALGPMLREYIISEAMHGLNIPTTRSLAVVATGEMVQREVALQGAVLTRVASSHLRVGTFQYLAARQDIKSLKELVSYTIKRHYPEFINSKNQALELLRIVIKKQAYLIAEWMRVSFIHGVMNTDNMTISGETIDYGPCAFMDYYDPKTVFSSIDLHGRYAFGNQPNIAEWNLARFAESILPLFDLDNKKAISIAEQEINNFKDIFKNNFTKMMKGKLGLISNEIEDDKLMKDLFQLMFKNEADYTNTFVYLMNGSVPQEKLIKDKNFIEWKNKWNSRLSRNQDIIKAKELMTKNNPIIIPRNHLIESALSKAEQGNLDEFNKLILALKDPYKDNGQYTGLKNPAPQSEKKYQTFCGT